MNKKVGRPKAKHPKSRVIPFRVTDEEFDALSALAKERGMTLSAIAREAMILQTTRPLIRAVSMRFDSIVAMATRGGLSGVDAETLEYLYSELHRVTELLELETIISTKGASVREADKITKELLFVFDPSKEDIEAGIQHTEEVMGNANSQS